LLEEGLSARDVAQRLRPRGFPGARCTKSPGAEIWTALESLARGQTVRRQRRSCAPLLEREP
jgi:hypothetical protein